MGLLGEAVLRQLVKHRNANWNRRLEPDFPGPPALLGASERLWFVADISLSSRGNRKNRHIVFPYVHENQSNKRVAEAIDAMGAEFDREENNRDNLDAAIALDPMAARFYHGYDMGSVAESILDALPASGAAGTSERREACEAGPSEKTQPPTWRDLPPLL
jgi:hypothetical protein